MPRPKKGKASSTPPAPDSWAVYGVLVGIKTQGDANFSYLFTAWLYGHSIVVTAISVILSQFHSGSHNLFLPSWALVLAILGCLLALQMRLALTRLRVWNGYVGNKLIEIENCVTICGRRLYKDRKDLFDGSSVPDSSASGFELLLLKIDTACGGLRAILVPWIFLAFYLLVIAWAARNLLTWWVSTVATGARIEGEPLMHVAQLAATYAAAINAGVAVALLFITGYYAYTTRKMATTNAKMLAEMKAARDLAPQPMIRVIPARKDDEEVPTLLDLIVTNIGNAPARDVELYALCSIQDRQYKYMHKLIDMGVGEERTIDGLLSSDPSLKEMMDVLTMATQSVSVEITTSYANVFNARFSRRQKYDFSAQRKAVLVSEETNVIPPARP